MKTHAFLLITAVATGCVTNTREKANHSFFGGEQGNLAEASEPAPPEREGPSEFEVDSGFGIAVTPPKTWTPSEPSAAFGLTITSPSDSIVTFEAFKDDGTLEQVQKWHEEFGKLASDVTEPLAEATLVGEKAWVGKYQFLVNDSVVSRTVWELPHKGTFYRIHVVLADVGDRYEAQTLVDSIRFVPGATSELSKEILGASVESQKLGSAKFAVAGWQKSEDCANDGCVEGWWKEDAKILVWRRDYATTAAAQRDLPLRTAQWEERSGGSARPAKYGKNNGQLVEGDGERIWLGQSGSSLWTIQLVSTADGLKSFSKSFDKAIAAARFK